MKLKKKGLPVWKTVVIIILLLLFTVLTISAAFLLLYKPNIDHQVPFETNDPAKPPTTQPTSDSAVPVETNAPNQGELMRKKNFYNFLLVGKDELGGHTDVTILASFDVVNHKITMMQIPRDTYANYKAIGSDVVSYRINTLYADGYGKARSAGETDLTKGGMERFVVTLQSNLNIKIDGYAYIDLYGLRKIVDILGGVEVNVPFDMDYEDPEQNLYIHLQAGEQTLNGSQAEGFIRFRKSHTGNSYAMGDTGRNEAQKIFLSALLNKIKTKLNDINVLTQLAEQALKYTNTSFSITDCVYFAKELLAVDFAEITMFTMPGEAVQNQQTGAWYYVMYREDMVDIIDSYFNVYNKPISSFSDFDKNRVFTSDETYINAVYLTPSTGAYKVYNAKDIQNNGIDIPLSGPVPMGLN